MRAESASCPTLSRSRAPRVQPPEVDLHLDARFTTPRMKLALVAGVHPRADNRRWTLVARNGTPTSVLKGARLYSFTRAGLLAGQEDGKRLHVRLKCDGGWTPFVSRVLVEGPWERPEAVTPVWVVERLERPVPVDYYFE